MTAPRLLSLDSDGHLQIEPAPELEVLRLDQGGHGPVDLAADSEVPVEGVGGDCLELAVEIDPLEAKEVGLKVLRSSWRRGGNRSLLGRRGSGAAGRRQPVVARPGDPLHPLPEDRSRT